MTKRNFIAIAAALRSNVPSVDSNAYEAETLLFENIVSAICDMSERFNPRFDRERFEHASGLDSIRSSRKDGSDVIDERGRHDANALTLSETLYVLGRRASH
jgi:hypothetical protein